MKDPISLSHGQFRGIPVTSLSYEADEEPGASVPEPVSPFIQPSFYGCTSTQGRKDYVIQWMNKLTKRADGYVQRIREHVSLGPKIAETVKGKLSLSARIIQAGGVERVFRQVFYVEKGEKLLKASQCYLSTTAGPVAGMLFISTEKVAFHSDRSLKLTSPNGELARVPYKVLIPLRRIEMVVSRENSSKPKEKYIQIATVDEFEFWFMGFLSYKKSFNYLQRAIFISKT